MQITAALVKELRERTGAGMMECKRALEGVNGDIEAAIEAMRKSGQAKAAKKAGRIAAEGLIVVNSSADNKSAIMLEVNCETDFVAKDQNFIAFTNIAASCGLAAKVNDLDGLMALQDSTGQTITQLREALVAKIGENITIRRVAFLTSPGIVAHYVHSGRIGTLVQLSVADQELGKDLAMHVAASKPVVLSEADLSAELIAKEKEICLAQVESSGKPQEILEKMVIGRLKKFTSEVVLLQQPFIKDPSIDVANLLKARGAEVSGFIRFEVGEGIEKQETDFAQEVMAVQAAGRQ